MPSFERDTPFDDHVILRLQHICFFSCGHSSLQNASRVAWPPLPAA